MPGYTTVRSDEIQEIIGTSPSWLLRAGAGYVLVLVLLVLALSSGVRYPDVLPASIVVTTDPAPYTAVTRVSGTLQLLVREGQWVGASQALGYVESAAAYAEVQVLKRYLGLPAEGGGQQDYKFKQLGSLQAPYESFYKATSEYQHFQRADDYNQQVRTLAAEATAYEQLNHALTSRRQLQLQEMGLVSKRYTIDANLLRDKVIAQTDADASQRLLLQQQQNVVSSRANIITNGITASELRRRIIELETQRSERQHQLRLGQEQAERSLRNALTQWQEDHMLLARSAGRVALLKEWIAGQFVPLAVPILSVLPPATMLVGRLRLPVAGSGKVRAGQRVNILLDNYPAEQFGMLEGQVARVAPLPQGNSYDVVVQLPARLITTYRRPIAFKQQLQGRAEIITEDLSILQRVFYQFRGLWQETSAGLKTVRP